MLLLPIRVSLLFFVFCFLCSDLTRVGWGAGAFGFARSLWIFVDLLDLLRTGRPFRPGPSTLVGSTGGLGLGLKY